MVKKSVGWSKFHHVVYVDDHDEDHYDEEEEHDDQDDEEHDDRNDEEHHDNYNENDDYNANCQIPVRPLNFRIIKIVNDTKQNFYAVSLNEILIPAKMMMIMFMTMMMRSTRVKSQKMTNHDMGVSNLKDDKDTCS